MQVITEKQWHLKNELLFCICLFYQGGCSNYYCCAMCVLSYFNCVWLFKTLWTVACQAPLSMGFSRQKYWSGLLSFWGSPQPRDQAHVSFISCICRCVLYHSSHLESPSGSPLFINAYNGKRIKNIALYSICIRKLKAMSKTNSVFISVYVWWGRDTGMGGRH